MKAGMLQRLKEYENNLRHFRNQIKKLEKERINRKELMTSAEEISKAWFDKFENQLGSLFKVPNEILEKYRNYFDRLMKLSRPNNRKSSYLDTLNKICKKFKDDLIIPVQQFSHQIVTDLDLVNIIQGISNIEEKKYLKEAIDCANHGFPRASIVMGWCAAIDRIQRKILSLGLERFNQTSTMLKNQSKGRFKRWNKEFSISTLSELQQVFDSDLIIVLEGMGLIDANQSDRIFTCFQ